ncbi:collagenase [Streptomyces cinnamoneus]|uniref:microbial collagenase n=1 Tax=Streptomyces cinnamoneus TaxID=53446 RepID=A0A2G1XAJ1_STRCJ|nr:collagenase [Streptomyces cinnamoneus]PHQ48189.1 collagenase [Streptomyces cinnamoneus]PPT15815.1 collagenase [Streptomyces cinnamoneus]
MNALRTARKGLLAATLAACLALPAAQAAAAAPGKPPTRPPVTATDVPGTPHDTPHKDPRTDVDRLAVAPEHRVEPPAPGGGKVSPGRIPGDLAEGKAGRPDGVAQGGAVPCTLDGITGLNPDRLADFLTDPAVTADGCLRGLIWTWDARLAPVMSRAHVQAVARRAASLAPSHGGTDATHLYELFTYLHAVVYHDFSRTEIDVTDAPTVDAMRRAIAAFGGAARTFDPTKQNADTLREALTTGSAPGLRQHQLGLISRVLDTLGPKAATATDPSWGGAALAALSTNYLGIYPGNNDTAFRNAVAANSAYRAGFRAFARHVHLKGTANAWAVRDALSEYGRFGQIDSLRTAIVGDLGALLKTAEGNFGDLSAPWASLASWLNFFEDCKRFNVCKPQIEARVFPRTYTYDKGGIEVRTALDRSTVDQLYYASKQVKAHFLRVLGTDAPLAGDPNATLHIHLYASRADYEVLHPLLTGMGTKNGGVYIEEGATFYTYQRRVPQDSQLTLEELFRHEYTHYLNGRWAVPGMFGDSRWFANDLTTAMDEGTAEFFDGATRDEGIKVRKSLVKGIIRDTAGGGPRMTVNRLLHSTYDGDGFRFYDYAGTFFEFLWEHHPSLLREMYGYQRADDPKGFDDWRTRTGADAGLQREYDAFLDEHIAKVDDLYVPATTFTPVGSLKLSRPTDVATAFASATQITPACTGNGDTGGKPRFTCTGRITANLTDSHDADQVFVDMTETVDYFILHRSESAANNFADMNCSFSSPEIWSTGSAATSSFSCEGPLRA